MAVLSVGLVLAGCGQQTAGQVIEAPLSGPSGKVERTQTASEAGLVTATCPSGRSGGGTIDCIPPSTRAEAESWAQSPHEAAHNTQTAPAFKGTLGRGEMVEREASARKVVYAVMEGERQIGQLTVRPVGFGAFATELVEACSP